LKYSINISNPLNLKGGDIMAEVANENKLTLEEIKAKEKEYNDNLKRLRADRKAIEKAEREEKREREKTQKENRYKFAEAFEEFVGRFIDETDSENLIKLLEANPKIFPKHTKDE
jgi:hypothetical protein